MGGLINACLMLVLFFSHAQLSRGIVDDLSDCSEQTNRGSASPKRLAVTAPDQEEEPASLSTESNHSSDNEPENRTTTPVHHRSKKHAGANQMQCHCPHCPDRVFARPCQLAMHMKTHTGKALVNLPDEMMDVKMKPPKVLHFMFSSVRNSVCRYEYMDFFLSFTHKPYQGCKEIEEHKSVIEKAIINHYSEYLG